MTRRMLPVADPFGIYPDRRPTLHQFCTHTQRCKGPGCRAYGRKWPRKREPKAFKILKEKQAVRLFETIPHRIVDLLPVDQVIALWEFRMRLVNSNG